jgi:hypothetical protein
MRAKVATASTPLNVPHPPPNNNLHQVPWPECDRFGGFPGPNAITTQPEGDRPAASMRSGRFGKSLPAKGSSQDRIFIKTLTRIIKILVKQGRSP